MTILMQQTKNCYILSKQNSIQILYIDRYVAKKNRIKFTERVNKSVYLHRRI